MKYAINQCHTCNRLKDDSCKNPVSRNKRDAGECSSWTNPELYEKWRAENGADVDAMNEFIDGYLARREQEMEESRQ